jgi:hypothetical protein
MSVAQAHRNRWLTWFRIREPNDAAWLEQIRKNVRIMRWLPAVHLATALAITWWCLKIQVFALQTNALVLTSVGSISPFWDHYFKGCVQGFWQGNVLATFHLLLLFFAIEAIHLLAWSKRTQRLIRIWEQARGPQSKNAEDDQFVGCLQRDASRERRNAIFALVAATATSATLAWLYFNQTGGILSDVAGMISARNSIAEVISLGFRQGFETGLLCAMILMPPVCFAAKFALLRCDYTRSKRWLEMIDRAQSPATTVAHG